MSGGRSLTDSAVMVDESEEGFSVGTIVLIGCDRELFDVIADIPMDTIDTPLLFVTSSNCGLCSMITVNIRSIYSRKRSLIKI